MTTLAYKDGIIAYDSRSMRGDYIECDHTHKRHDHEGHIFILSGYVSDFEPFMSAAITEESGKSYGCGGFMIDPEGVLWTVGGEDTPWRARHDLDAPTAFGSGMPFAVAAMDFGHTAKQAVKYAMTRDPGTGGKVRTLKLRKKK